MLKDIIKLNNQCQSLSSQDILAYIRDAIDGDICFASSLGAEDQVLTHMIRQSNLDISIFVLDTGRLPKETYQLMQQTMLAYGINYDVYCPKGSSVESMVRLHGPNLFYDSLDKRKSCCYVRKVEPLERALKRKVAWVTGLRRAQSIDRATLDIIEWDDVHQMIKTNPLAKWSKHDVWDYIKANNVPYNMLHDQGYPSIGCAPCTRAIQPGEDDRAGRWWWEKEDKKECGLHVSELPKKENI